MISRNTSPLYAYSPEYQKRRAAPLSRGFVLVRNPGTRRALVHVVKAETFGELARVLISGKVVKTLCERAVVTGSWEMIPRQPDGGYLISCSNCRGALSHYRETDPSSSV
jgi:hypothetical protein